MLDFQHIIKLWKLVSRQSFVWQETFSKKLVAILKIKKMLMFHKRTYVCMCVFELSTASESALWSVLQKRCSKKLPETCRFVKKETLTQVYSCIFCEVNKSTFFIEYFQ